MESIGRIEDKGKVVRRLEGAGYSFGGAALGLGSEEGIENWKGVG